MTTEYVDLTTLKLYLQKDSDGNDALLTQALKSASRAIEKWCGGRQFYLDSSATAREFLTAGSVITRGGADVLLIDDLGDATGLLVEGAAQSTYSTVAASGYEFAGRTLPYDGLRAISGSGWSGYRKVRVTGKWGWPAIPDEIVQACLILAGRWYRRKDSQEGVLGTIDGGMIRVGVHDPDVKMLLKEFRYTGFGA